MTQTYSSKVQIKRKETERSQSVRLQSFAHLKSKEDAEPWQHLRVQAIGSEESEETFEKMYLPSADQDLSSFN